MNASAAQLIVVRDLLLLPCGQIIDLNIFEYFIISALLEWDTVRCNRLLLKLIDIFCMASFDARDDVYILHDLASTSILVKPHRSACHLGHLAFLVIELLFAMLCSFDEDFI